MAGLGWKLWTRERLSQTDLQGYLQDQVVARFASAAARATAIASPSEGMFSYLLDVDRLDFYDGAAWKPWRSAWAQTLEANKAAGTAAPIGTPLTTHDWQVVVSTNGSGDATIFYPAVFPNGVQALQFTVGDTTGNVGFVAGTGAALSSCTVRVFQPGGAVVASLSVRINCRAVGW